MNEAGDVLVIGRIIATARKLRNMTQADLAAVVGLSQAYVSAIERGDGNITLTVLVKLARALGLREIMITDDVAASFQRWMDVPPAHVQTLLNRLEMMPPGARAALAAIAKAMGDQFGQPGTPNLSQTEAAKAAFHLTGMLLSSDEARRIVATAAGDRVQASAAEMPDDSDSDWLRYERWRFERWRTEQAGSPGEIEDEWRKYYRLAAFADWRKWRRNPVREHEDEIVIADVVASEEE